MSEGTGQTIKVVAATFSNESGAARALEVLSSALAKDQVGNAAVLKMSAKGELEFEETEDPGFKKGAVRGGVAGGVAGLILPGVGTVIGAALGGAATGLAAKLRDSGFPDERLKELGKSLTPGTSALVAVIEEDSIERAEGLLRELDANVVTEGVEAELASLLDEERHG